MLAAHLGGTPDEREKCARRIGAELAHQVRVARPRAETTISEMGVAALSELGFQVNSVLWSFGTVTVQLCTCPLAKVAETAPEVVRGIQQGRIQEVVDCNATANGAEYRVAVTPDSGEGLCEVVVVLDPR